MNPLSELTIDDAVAVLACQTAVQRRVRGMTKQADLPSMLNQYLLNPITPGQRAVQGTAIGAGVGGGLGLLRSVVDKKQRKSMLANTLQGATIGGAGGLAYGVTQPLDPSKGMLGTLFGKTPEGAASAKRDAAIKQMDTDTKAGRVSDPAVVAAANEQLSADGVSSSDAPVAPATQQLATSKAKWNAGQKLEAVTDPLTRRPGLGAGMGAGGFVAGHTINAARANFPSLSNIQHHARTFENVTGKGSATPAMDPAKLSAFITDKQKGWRRFVPALSGRHRVLAPSGEPLLAREEYGMLQRHARDTMAAGKGKGWGRAFTALPVALSLLGYGAAQVPPISTPYPQAGAAK